MYGLVIVPSTGCVVTPPPLLLAARTLSATDPGLVFV